MSIVIRPMKQEDIGSVFDIESECFSAPWSKQAFADELSENVCAKYVVAEVDGKTAGYGGMWLIINEAHITNIAVTSDSRKSGLGSMILESLMQIAWDTLEIKRMTLEVRKSNFAAQRLYRKYDFMNAGERKKYYDNGEDAIIMWCNDISKFVCKNTK